MRTYEFLENVIIGLYSKNLLNKEVLESILLETKGFQMDTGNAEPTYSEDGMTLPFIIMKFYEPEKFNNLLKKINLNDEDFWEFFHEDNFIWDFHKQYLEWW